MPELPEVEVTRRGLLADMRGTRILAYWWSGKGLRTAFPKRLLEEHIMGQRVLDIDRRAKYLLFRMDTGAVLSAHLGMTGRLGLLPQGRERQRHDHLVLSLDTGQEVRFNDSRRFGAILVWPGAQAAALEAALSAREGMEPFSEEFRPEALARLARGRSVPIKSFLMNGRLIAGIGNIYASEILFAAHVHPLMPTGNLRIEHWERVVLHSQRILRESIEAGGSSISDFLKADGHPGWFQLQLKVYGRRNQPCPACSRPVEVQKIGGRSTFFCPFCQPLKAAWKV